MYLQHLFHPTEFSVYFSRLVFILRWIFSEIWNLLCLYELLYPLPTIYVLSSLILLSKGDFTWATKPYGGARGSQELYNIRLHNYWPRRKCYLLKLIVICLQYTIIVIKSYLVVFITQKHLLANGTRNGLYSVTVKLARSLIVGLFGASGTAILPLKFILKDLICRGSRSNC